MNKRVKKPPVVSPVFDGYCPTDQQLGNKYGYEPVIVEPKMFVYGVVEIIKAAVMLKQKGANTCITIKPVKNNPKEVCKQDDDHQQIPKNNPEGFIFV